MQGFTARIKYTKNGLVRFIGHLDTTRALLRAVRRAGIEGVYTQGFSPRLRVSFGFPLPLGCTSECEYLDLRLAKRGVPETIKERMQASLPQGLAVEEVTVLEGEPPSLQASFCAAEYEIEVPESTPLDPDRLTQLASYERDRPAGPHDPGTSDRTAWGRLVRASWNDKDAGTKVLSLTLREGGPGGRLKEVVGNLLGLDAGEVEKLRIHRKRLYPKRETV